MYLLLISFVIDDSCWGWYFLLCLWLGFRYVFVYLLVLLRFFYLLLWVLVCFYAFLGVCILACGVCLVLCCVFDLYCFGLALMCFELIILVRAVFGSVYVVFDL